MKKQFLSLLAAAVSVVCFGSAFAQDAPKQAMREVPFTEVKLADNFWAPRIEANASTSTTPTSIRSSKDSPIRSPRIQTKS